MHTQILDQIATREPQFDPDQFSRSKQLIAPAEPDGIFNPVQRICSGNAECIYFLEPEIEDIIAIIQRISSAAEFVVLNSDIGYLSQICTYLNNPAKKLKPAFIISIDETRKLQCWNIDLESARQIGGTQPISGFSKWTIDPPKPNTPIHTIYSKRQQ